VLPSNSLESDLCPTGEPSRTQKTDAILYPRPQLAMDESNPTGNQRFAELGIPQTEEARSA
jgi:hypothetical protein